MTPVINNGLNEIRLNHTQSQSNDVLQYSISDQPMELMQFLSNLIFYNNSNVCMG